MSEEPSYYYEDEETLNEGVTKYVPCKVCKGSGIDPQSAKSHQDDEWDCIECEGWGSIECV